MAGDWIKFEKTTLDKPEVFEMAGILGIDPDAVIGKLLRVWDWFDDQSIDGYAPVTLRAQLNRNTGVTNFVTAMEQVGWMNEENGKLCIPNFHRHNGETAKQRALSAKRMAKKRQKSYADSVTSSVTNPQPEKRREEKSVGENDPQAHSLDNKRFQKPTIDEVAAYGLTLTPPFTDALQFCAFYESKGWVVGKSPMKSWKSAITTWRCKDARQTNGHHSKPKNSAKTGIIENLEFPEL